MITDLGVASELVERARRRVTTTAETFEVANLAILDLTNALDELISRIESANEQELEREGA